MCTSALLMSSSADNKPVRRSKSRPKRKATEAVLTREEKRRDYKAARTARAVERYNKTLLQKSGVVEIDLREEAGPFRCQTVEPDCLILERAKGEILIVSKSVERPGEWRVTYDRSVASFLDPWDPKGGQGPE